MHCIGQPNTRHLKYYSVFAIVLALRNCQFQTQQDNRHERLRYSVGGVYMLCGYDSTFKAYDLPTLFHKVHSRILTTNINNGMKRIFATLFLVITTITVFAQTARVLNDSIFIIEMDGHTYEIKNNVIVKFLGHPVDGSKSKMEAHLRNKGFIQDSYSDFWEGDFNGSNVDIYINTYKNKVNSIIVLFPERGKVAIINEYNNLLRQFKDNSKYSEMEPYTNTEIPKNENILYEMSINDKAYEATFFLEEEMETMCPYFYNNVEFKIFQEDNEKYRIVLYYNHFRNFPKGEDL